MRHTLDSASPWNASKIQSFGKSRDDAALDMAYWSIGREEFFGYA